MDRAKRIWYLSPMRAVSQEELSDRKPDPWAFWMSGHVQLKFVMTECSKTQIRLTGLKFCLLKIAKHPMQSLKKIHHIIELGIWNKVVKDMYRWMDRKTFECYNTRQGIIRENQWKISRKQCICIQVTFLTQLAIWFLFGFYSLLDYLKHTCCLISVFIVRCLDSIIPTLSILKLGRL